MSISADEKNPENIKKIVSEFNEIIKSLEFKKSMKSREKK